MCIIGTPEVDECKKRIGLHYMIKNSYCSFASECNGLCEYNVNAKLKRYFIIYLLKKTVLMKYLKKTIIGTKIVKYMGISDKYKFR